MKILVFSPLEMPFHTGARYTGLERLAAQFASEFAKQGHDVTLMAHKSTDTDVKLMACDGYEEGRATHAEQRAFQRYMGEFKKFDVIWDITHLQLPARFMPYLPTVNIFHANPEYAKACNYQKAGYNLVSWSKWGVREIQKYYGKNAVYQETIIIDSSVYKPSGKRGNRLLTIGRMSPEKGNLNAVLLCKKLGIPLDVVGGRGSEIPAGTPLTKYEQEIKDNCDSTLINFYGEVSDEEKIELMQKCKALIYITDHVEITSHKVQECMMCGAPAIIPNQGGFAEIVTHGVDGFLCDTVEDYVQAIKNIDKFDMSKTSEQIIKKYDPVLVSKDYLELMTKVAGGLRW